MPFIWNDKTYWKRVKYSNKILFKVTIPLYLFCLFIWFLILYPVVSFEGVALLAVPSSMVIYGVVDVFLQLPHPRIPDTYSKNARTLLYFINLIIALVFFYIVFVGNLQHYYPFIKYFSYFDIVKNFPKI